MVGSAPSARADAGGQLLRELEALSAALYKASSGSVRERRPRSSGDGGQGTRRSFDDTVKHEAGLVTWHSQGYQKKTTMSGSKDVADLPDWLDGTLLGVSGRKEEEAAGPSPLQHRKKKGSLWDWKPLRALAHIGQRRYNCLFTAHVHGIKKLPASLEGLRLQVRLKYKDSEVQTVPALVFKGSADFEEALRLRCAIYGSSTSSGGVRYMSKSFTLSVVAPDVGELELGKHRLDLSRILPEDAADRSGKPGSSWNTSFKLSGRAKGGVLVITFGYEMVMDGATAQDEGSGQFCPQSPDVRGGLRSFNSLPNSPQAAYAIAAHARSKPVVGMASPAQSEPELMSEYSIDIEQLNLDEDDDEDDGGVGSPTATTMTMSHGNSSSSGLLAPGTPGRQQEEELKGFSLEQSEEVGGEEEEDGNADFTVIDQGVEESESCVEQHEDNEHEHEQSRNARAEINAAVQEEEEEEETIDDEAEIVAGEFLHMLGPSSDSEETDSAIGYSPRALLLKQFEQEQAMLRGGFGMELDVPSEMEQQPRAETGDWSGEEDLSAFLDAAESELQKATQVMKSKARAKMLEDAEAEALMQEWGLNEKAFQNSPPKAADDWMMGNPSLSTALIPMPEAPCLAEGLGTMIPTRDGGLLRSMNPIHFQGGRNEGRLVLHVSKSVVVPADMGSSVLDIFRGLAAGGAENMGLQVMGAMPLEDITGKTVHQIAMEGQACLGETNKRYALGAGESGNRLALEYGHASAGPLAAKASSSGSLFDTTQRRAPGTSSSTKYASTDDTYMSLDELAPVAMEKIEALAMQGLKIQSDMAEEEAPYTVDPLSRNNKRLEGSGAMHLLETEQDSSADGLLAMSISLDEWMRLDAGVYDEAETTDKTMAVLAAHHAAHSTDIVLMSGDDDNTQRGSRKGSQASAAGKGGGLMGDTLTLAMLVQLRDPLRNYEPVGAPMMALVQAERVVVPPRPKMWKRVSLQGNSEEDDEKVDEQPQFKITGVHMAGLKPSDSSLQDNKKKIWGTQKQQQSGSRWLLAQGMGKTGAGKHPLLKSSKPAPAKNNNKQGESLWSISARVSDSSSKAPAAKAPAGITRNPDVRFGSRFSFGKKW